MKEVDQVILQQVVDDMNAKEKEHQAYFESPAMQGTMEQVKDYLKNHDVIDDEDMLYYPERYPMSVKEFHDLFNCLRFCVREKQGEKGNPFPCWTWEYQGVIFRLMLGQGAACQAWQKSYYNGRMDNG